MTLQAFAVSESPMILVLCWNAMECSATVLLSLTAVLVTPSSSNRESTIAVSLMSVCVQTSPVLLLWNVDRESSQFQIIEETDSQDGAVLSTVIMVS